MQRLLQVAQLPDAALVLLVQLRVAHRDNALVAERRQDALIVRRPLALLVVENRQGPPEATLLEHRGADGGLNLVRVQVRRRLNVEGQVDVWHRRCAQAQHRRADDALSVLKLHTVEVGRETNRHDRHLVSLFRAARQKAGRAIDHPDRNLERLLLEDSRTLSDGGQRLRHLSQRIERRVKARCLPRDHLQDP